MSEAKKREVQPVAPNRHALGEHARLVHVLTVESSEHPEDFQTPEFYAHVARNMRPFDHIELRTDDGTYWAELLVVTADLNWAKVHLLREERLQTEEQHPINSDFAVEWKGPHRKWCVIRKTDKSAISENHLDRGAADAWLTQHSRTVGRKAA